MKITGPLQSISASGTIAKNLTFSLRKSGQQVRWQKKQKDKITTARTTQRAKFQIAMEAWKYWDYGIINYGFQCFGGKDVNISGMLRKNRAPKFACYIRDYLG